ncbi:LytR/AlgR family response regulator transcription factor [Nubsella zeaxanthinifaciens]|jgi:two-component system LytT family response regulator|uniref:LytR/AlgR family response regulator transcription factor n=1 Tax=Nubsella zeaxanthinifaciens TaxID=392412 RepID=UPI0018E50DF4|nr:LytTR family DNA-binding domain-containing protein [Nubsella zeaxanthinifaciens]
MMQLSCFIVDDEPIAIETLSLLIGRFCPSLKIIGNAVTVKQALTTLQQQTVDILFLDIRMQQETGFDLLAQTGTPSFHIIFVTAHDDYGIQAIKFSATDYLLKPVNAEELIAAVHKISQKKQSDKEQVELLLQSYVLQKQHQQKRIALPDQTEIKFVPIDDIICCKADNTYTTFYLVNDKTILVSKPISEYESLLEPYGFVRVHQSWLTNSAQVISYKKEDGGYLLMSNKIKIPVSRQRKHLLKRIQ